MKDHGRHALPEKKGISSWLIALVINAAIMAAVFAFTDIMYETNDDFGIAAKIASGFPYIGFVNYYLCVDLAWVQAHFQTVNIFILSQLVMSFLSFTMILRTIIERGREDRRWPEMVLAAVVTAFYSLDHYSSLQFTKTSALLMTAGLILLVDTYLNDRRVVHFILAFLVFAVGVGYRERGMFPSLAYAGIFVLLWWILNRKTFMVGRKLPAEIALVAVIGVFALAPYGIDMLSDRANASTPELKTYREYQAERVKITDYPVYKYYRQNIDKYNEIGLSDNDVYLVSHWLLDYDGVASYDNLKKINEINYPCVLADRSVSGAAGEFVHETYKSVRALDFTGMHILIICALALAAILVTRPRSWLYVIAIGTLTAGIYVIIYYLQRPQYRAFYVADVAAAFWLIYVMVSTDRHRFSKGLSIVACLAIVALTGFLTMPAIHNLDSQHAKILGKIQSDEMTEFYQEHADTFYVCSTGSKKRHPSYADPLKVPVVEKNATGMGGWGTLSPYELDQLAEFGMNNLVGALIDNDNIYYLGKKNKNRLTEYYNKWYGDDKHLISFRRAGTAGNYALFSIVSEEIN